MMRLNLGCGEFKADGWVNVDRQPWVKPDVVASIEQLPFKDGAAEMIYAGHVLEHIAPEALPAVFAEMRRVLAPDCRMMVVGPDLERAEAHFPHEVPSIKKGAERWDGDAHLWDSTEQLTLEFLVAGGWKVAPVPIEDVSSAWPIVSRIGWQFAAVCW